MEQAIQTAIEYETRVRDVYRAAAADCGEAAGRKIFAILADEEQQHLDYLHNRLAEWHRTGRVTLERLETRIPPREAIQAGIEKLTSRVESKQCGDEIDLVSKALAVETETSEFYLRLVDELPLEQRKLFERFVEIEQGHLAIVQAELDNLRGLGFYFDYQEFDLETG